MHRVVILGIVAAAFLLASGPPSGADQPPNFFSIARGAIGDPQTLAKVHSVHVALSGQTLGSGLGDDPRGTSVNKIQIWLDPPSRFLERVVAGAGRTQLIQNGIDGTRLIAHNSLPEVTAARLQRAKLRRYALALLLFDPDALGVALSDEGTVTINRHVVRVLDAADEVGFDLRLYFDPASHRLLMTDDFTMTSHGFIDVVNGQTIASAMSAPTRTPERISYGEYRRVDGIELPFSISREVKGKTDVWHVIGYQLNPADLDAVFKR